MTIGMERHMYPFLMAERECWPQSTVIVNCSQPGITSADASSFFFRHRKDYKNVRAVVVHVGTCDSVSAEIRKGKYTLFRQMIADVRERMGVSKGRSRLQNRLLHFEWNPSCEIVREYPEKLADFKYNLARIVRACVRSSIPVILMRPRSHLNFPAGSGKGNFIFYRYHGIRDRIADRLTIPDGRFVETLRLHESGEYSKAQNGYCDILLNSDALSSNPEYILMVVNNYAVCAAEAGNLKESEFLLRLLLRESGSRKEIVLYNLAQVCRARGDVDTYQSYLDESLETDSSMYRIRTPYTSVIDQIADTFASDVRVIDVGALIEDDLYIDHCHPVKEGQERIAHRVLQTLEDLDVRGRHAAEVRNILYNPELALGNTTEFYAYFKTYAPYTSQEIAALVDRAKLSLSHHESSDRKIPNDPALPKEMNAAFEYYLRYPAFPSVRDVLRFGPMYPSDMGRFPEYFLIRYIIPYLRIHERDQSLKSRFTPEIGVLRTVSELTRVLPSPAVSLIAPDDPFVDPEFESIRLSRILEKVSKGLLEHLLRGNQVYERLKTTIFWYFRETLRFGSHSRISMRYDRIFLEYTAESLALAGVLDSVLGRNRSDEIFRMIALVEETTRIHDHYCRNFTMNSDSRHLLEEYDGRLYDVAAKLKDIRVNS
jgi:hypothetical protein